MIQTIAKDPYNVNLRLVYADWLADQGKYDESETQRLIASKLENPFEKDQLSNIIFALQRANGRRKIRTLELTDVLRCAKRALIDDWDAVGGGNVANSYGFRAYQTVCVCARRSDYSIRCGITIANANGSLTKEITGLNTNAKPEKFREWAEQGNLINV